MNQIPNPTPLRQRKPRVKDRAHLDWLKLLPCLNCWTTLLIDPAHIRYASNDNAKPITGVGTKPNDQYAIPLCRRCHKSQHASGEREWWAKRGIDPLAIAEKLYVVSGDIQAGEEIVMGALKCT